MTPLLASPDGSSGLSGWAQSPIAGVMKEQWRKKCCRRWRGSQALRSLLGQAWRATFITACMKQGQMMTNRAALYTSTHSPPNPASCEGWKPADQVSSPILRLSQPPRPAARDGSMASCLLTLTRPPGACSTFHCQGTGVAGRGLGLRRPVRTSRVGLNPDSNPQRAEREGLLLPPGLCWC